MWRQKAERWLLRGHFIDGVQVYPFTLGQKNLHLFLQQISSERLLWASCADAGSTMGGVVGWESNMIPTSRCLLAYKTLFT